MTATAERKRKTYDWNDVDEMAKEMANNHARFECFMWTAEPADSENWAIVYTHNRDSDLMAESNAAEIDKAMEKFPKDAVSERHNHWACGWVDGYVLRVYRNGKITKAFRAYCELQARIADYPLLNESDHSEREYEAAIKWIEQEGRKMVHDDAKEWAGKVFSWLWEHEQRELENTDGTGAAPSDKSIKRALLATGLFCGDWEVKIGDFLYLNTQNQKSALKEYRNLLYHASMGCCAWEGEITIWLDGEDASETVEWLDENEVTEESEDGHE